jgi:glycosyltransferase involved in cell wall biosynthesis
MHIVYVNGADTGGGAYCQASDIRKQLLEMGNEVSLAVRVKYSNDPGVFEIGNDRCRNAWARLWFRAFGIDPKNEKLDPRQHRRRRIAIAIGQPIRTWRVLQGLEDVSFPGTQRILSKLPKKPDIVHLWNLHGGYFDLRVLPELCKVCPVVIDLQDNWMFTGHCSYFRDCTKWQNGCKPCTYPKAPPAMLKDRAGDNWSMKRDIYERSEYYVKAPCKWTYDRIEHSILALGMKGIKLITNSSDSSVFFPRDKLDSRRRLGLPDDALILMYAAQSIENSFYKDWATLRSAIQSLGKKANPYKILLMTVGDGSLKESSFGSVDNIQLPFVRDREKLAEHYSAADVFVHAGLEEVWGLTMTEAMMCGTPVIATAVGGIPEQVFHGVNGLLVPPQDPVQFANAIESLASRPELRQQLSRAAVEIAANRFNTKLAAEKHLSFYSEILSNQ